MTEAEVEVLAESGIPLCPTLTLICNFAQWGELVGVPVRKQDGAKRLLELSANALHLAHEAGVKLMTGTDSGFSVTPFGEWHGRELEVLMEYAGLSALEVIQAATQHGALALGLEGEVGVVEAGKLADVIVVDGDPLADIKVLQQKDRIKAVFKGGTRVEFDDAYDQIRWPYDRAQIISTDEITYDVVYGSGEQRAPEPIAWNGEDAEAMAAELKDVEVSAGLEQDWDN
jgi:imidazolonepropionase-like amidohydrolase